MGHWNRRVALLSLALLGGRLRLQRRAHLVQLLLHVAHRARLRVLEHVLLRPVIALVLLLPKFID